MKPKTRAIISFICAIVLLLCLIMLIVYCDIVKPRLTENPDDIDRLSGSQLRTMMNEARYSPGLASAYSKSHPDFAWLFDGSFVDYISD